MSKQFDKNGCDIKLSPKSRIVLEERYLKKNKLGEVVETSEEMFCRIAGNIALADAKYKSNVDIEALEHQFQCAMSNLEFLPNSPTLMNAGRESQQLAACFVLPIEDSIDSIFYAALIHQSEGVTKAVQYGSSVKMISYICRSINSFRIKE